jgi:hypothetical protein
MDKGWHRIWSVGGLEGTRFCRGSRKIVQSWQMPEFGLWSPRARSRPRRLPSPATLWPFFVLRESTICRPARGGWIERAGGRFGVDLALPNGKTSDRAENRSAVRRSGSHRRPSPVTPMVSQVLHREDEVDIDRGVARRPSCSGDVRPLQRWQRWLWPAPPTPLRPWHGTGLSAINALARTAWATLVPRIMPLAGQACHVGAETAWGFSIINHSFRVIASSDRVVPLAFGISAHSSW